MTARGTLGLGVELDMGQVRRLEKIEPTAKLWFIIASQYDHGPMLYTH